MPISGIRMQPGIDRTAYADFRQGAEGLPDAREVMQRKIREMNGSAEESGARGSFRIGGKSYTEEEWDRILAKVDRAIHVIKEENREELEKKEALEEAGSVGMAEQPEITEEQIAELFRDRG